MEELFFETEISQRQNEKGEDTEVAIYQQYRYHFKRPNKNGTVYWFCRHSKCKATLTTNGDQVQKVNGEEITIEHELVKNKKMGLIVAHNHNHKPNRTEEQVEVRYLTSNWMDTNASFPVLLWCCWEIFKRTNNNCETYVISIFCMEFFLYFMFLNFNY